MLATGQLTSHDPSSPYNFLTHTAIGSRYPENGYDNFFVFDQTGGQVQLHLLVSPMLCPLILFKIPNVFKQTELTDIDLVHEIIRPVPGGPTEPKVVLEGSQSGIKLTFDTNRKPYSYSPNRDSCRSPGSPSNRIGGTILLQLHVRRIWIQEEDPRG